MGGPVLNKARSSFLLFAEAFRQHPALFVALRGTHYTILQ
jgi:hypothetical protein